MLRCHPPGTTHPYSYISFTKGNRLPYRWIKLGLHRPKLTHCSGQLMRTKFSFLYLMLLGMCVKHYHNNDDWAAAGETVSLTQALTCHGPVLRASCRRTERPWTVPPRWTCTRPCETFPSPRGRSPRLRRRAPGPPPGWWTVATCSEERSHLHHLQLNPM